MSPPALLFAFLLASLYGVVFYFFFGRGWLGLAVYWLVALVGFGLGQLVTMLLGISLLPIGSVNIIEASLVSALALLLTRAVWRRAPRRK